jgi:hypothetical protein
MRDFAPLVMKGSDAMKINPATKTAVCKALGSLAERSVAMADAISKGEEDAGAPALLPEEMVKSVVALGSEFTTQMAAFMPQAAPAEPAVAPSKDPEVEMTAEMVTDSASTKMAAQLDTIEKGLKKSLTAGNVAKIAKGLEDVESLRKSLAEFPVAKGAAPKKLSFSQYMKMQGTLLERFMQLVMEFLPVLTAADEEPLPEPAAEPPLDMSKSIETAVAKSAEATTLAVLTKVGELLDQRMGSVNEQLTSIAKSRDGGAGLPPEARPSAGGNADDDLCIPFTSLTERMRAKGQLPKAS